MPLRPTPLLDALVQRGAFRDSPVCVIDVGAAGGVERHWLRFRDQLTVLAFDPDPAESVRLAAGAATAAGEVHFFPVALDRTAGHRTLNVARYAQASSFLSANAKLFERFMQAQCIQTVEEVSVKTATLDAVLTESGVQRLPTFIKLDVEGAELDVLTGASETLGSIVGLSVEVYFQEMHRDRPLFNDVDIFLRRAGFELFDLPYLERWTRKVAVAPARAAGPPVPQPDWYGSGQLVWGQAIYLRSADAILKCARECQGESAGRMLTKWLAVAELFGFPDVALEAVLQARSEGLLPSADADTYQSLLRRSIATQRKFDRPLNSLVRSAGKMTFERARAYIPANLRKYVRSRLQGTRWP
jgi:FkbM family methyltransferase